MSKDNHTPRFVQLPMFDPITVQLTRGCSAIIDPVDADLAAFKWHTAGAAHNNYAKREVSGKMVCLHRVIMGRILGRALSPDEKVDHIDGDRFNNRRDNLRLATQQQNTWNSKMMRKNKAGLKGASPHKDKWQAQIMVNGKKIYLGIYDTPEEAHSAYAEAARQFFGEFARLE